MISVMHMSWRRHAAELWVSFLLVGLTLAVPLSTTAKSIFVPLAALGIVLVPAYRHNLRLVLSEPWCRASLGLFVLVCLASAWSAANLHEKTMVIGKYSKLLYLPILAVGFSDVRVRRASLYAFLAAMLLTCLLSILKAVGWIKFNGDDPGNLFHTHIITGNMMAFAAYVSAWFWYKSSRKRRLVYATLFALFSYQIFFLSLGRTAYVMYAILMGIWMLQVLDWKVAAVALLLGGFALVLLYSQSATMQSGVRQAVLDWHAYQLNDNKDTPIGYRLQFHAFAKDLYARHPWLGNGTGSFTHSFSEEKPVPSWDRVLLEPHNQYWLLAVELGALGVLVFAWLVSTLFAATSRLQDMRPIALATLLPFLVGNLTDSLLFYSGSGFFFIVFMAISLGELFKKPILIDSNSGGIRR